MTGAEARESTAFREAISRFMEIDWGAECTEVAAAWCPIHGDCVCPDRETAMNDPACPLHAPGSEHGAERCPSCWNAIDPETCHCGEERKGHGSTIDVGHSFVPMGCVCGYTDRDRDKGPRRDQNIERWRKAHVRPPNTKHFKKPGSFVVLMPLLGGGARICVSDPDSPTFDDFW